MRFGFIHKTAADNDIIALFHFIHHAPDILGLMLTISVKLQYRVISMIQRILQTGLKSCGQAKIDGLIHIVKLMILDHLQCMITTAVINYNIIVLRIVFTQIIDNSGDILLFVIRRNNN